MSLRTARATNQDPGQGGPTTIALLGGHIVNLSSKCLLLCPQTSELRLLPALVREAYF